MRAVKDQSIAQLRLHAARLVRATYVFERSQREQQTYYPGVRWDGGTDSSGRTYKNIWLAIADKLLPRKIDPEQYVRCHFASGLPIWPNVMMSDASVNAFNGCEELTTGDLKAAFKFQKQLAATEIKLHQAMNLDKGPISSTISILLHEPLSLTALFRYCLAESLETKRSKKVMSLYFVQAVLQYYTNRKKHDLVWGEWITDTFRMKAAELMASVGGSA